MSTQDIPHHHQDPSNPVLAPVDTPLRQVPASASMANQHHQHEIDKPNSISPAETLEYLRVPPRSRKRRREPYHHQIELGVPPHQKAKYSSRHYEMSVHWDGERDLELQRMIRKTKDWEAISQSVGLDVVQCMRRYLRFIWANRDDSFSKIEDERLLKIVKMVKPRTPIDWCEMALNWCDFDDDKFMDSQPTENQPIIQPPSGNLHGLSILSGSTKDKNLIQPRNDLQLRNRYFDLVFKELQQNEVKKLEQEAHKGLMGLKHLVEFFEEVIPAAQPSVDDAYVPPPTPNNGDDDFVPIGSHDTFGDDDYVHAGPIQLLQEPSPPRKKVKKKDARKVLINGKITTDHHIYLNEWFLRHLHNPYPTEHEKYDILQACEGLGKKQLNHYVTNSRVRYYKPLVALLTPMFHELGKEGPEDLDNLEKFVPKKIPQVAKDMVPVMVMMFLQALNEFRSKPWTMTELVLESQLPKYEPKTQASQRRLGRR